MPPATRGPSRPRDRFFGRADDLEAARAILGHPAGRGTSVDHPAGRSATVDARSRLVTITGPGGIGKTRFALELAASLGADARAVHVCELGHAVDAAGIAAAVAAAIGAGAPGLVDPVEHVARVLSARDAPILILDELEHLVRFADATIGAWLDRCDAAFVVTSRVRLGIAGERVHELGPLALPDDEARPDAATGVSAALELFLDRARAAGAGEAVAAERDVVLDIVRRLEGMPLAIELAAGRLRVLGLADLAARMGRPLAVLSGGRGRHATLTRAIDDSWALLTPAERRALAQTSVFEGGFDVDAAEAILDVGDDEPALDRLQALVEKSMIARRTVAGVARLSLLESLRAYAAARLDEAGGADDARRRHADHYGRRAEAVMSTLAHARDAASASRARVALVRERHNFAAALAEAEGRADGRGAARVALHVALGLNAAARAFGQRGADEVTFATALGVARRAEAATALDDPTRGALARVLLARADGLRLSGDEPGLRRACDDALAIAIALGDGDLEAAALAARGDGLARAEPAAARADLERALALLTARPTSDTPRTRAIARTHIRLARYHHRAARPEIAIEHAAAAGHAAASIGDASEEAEAQLFLAAAHSERGDAEQVEAACLRALSLLHAPAGTGSAFADYVLGVSRQEAGRFEEAADLYVRAAARDRWLGIQRQEASTRMSLARLELQRGRLEEADRGLVAVLAPLAACGHRRSLGLALVALAATRARRGDVDAARRALDEAAGHADEVVDACAVIGAAIVDAARAAAAVDPEAAARLWASSSARLAEAALGELAARSEDVRTMLRIARPAGEAALPPLTVAEGCRWFRVGDAPPVDLRKKQSAARILDALVERRRAAPGVAVGLTFVLRAGWPGERVRADAGANRVYVAVSGLRKLGLRGLIVHGDDGWMLDPRAEVVVAATS